VAKRIINSTPKADGFRMPGEFEPQQQVWLVWPERRDVWRDGAYIAQEAYVRVANAISQFTKVTICASAEQYNHARTQMPEHIRVVEMSSNDAWVRDSGPAFLTNNNGELRAVDWDFNAWGGCFYPVDKDQAISRKIAEIEGADIYPTPGFVMEGGSFTVDGEGTLITTEMCLLHESRNPHLNKEQIEKMLSDYLNLEKVIWIKDGMDPEMTNGHIDDVVCFIRPGEVACIWTDDPQDINYQLCRDAYEILENATDAKGRKLKIHKLTLPKKPVIRPEGFHYDYDEQSLQFDDIDDDSKASYLNFLITNNGVVVPQFGDEYDELALSQIKGMYPEREVVGVDTREIIYAGGNIHCITQQQPRV